MSQTFTEARPHRSRDCTQGFDIAWGAAEHSPWPRENQLPKHLWKVLWKAMYFGYSTSKAMSAMYFEWLPVSMLLVRQGPVFLIFHYSILSRCFLGQHFSLQRRRAAAYSRMCCNLTRIGFGRDSRDIRRARAEDCRSIIYLQTGCL